MLAGTSRPPPSGRHAQGERANRDALTDDIVALVKLLLEFKLPDGLETTDHNLFDVHGATSATPCGAV